mmetsp:Transcript_17032/g.16456  ORF Transcript_17032/g.16456 Transcript_17032/m.16456 type:complete len:110 (-) Transcript_17032:378-707(-)
MFLPSLFQGSNFASSSFVRHHAATTTTIRFMSKYLSKSATKRLGLTTKRARKGFYKGKGGTTEGHFGKGGRFIIDRSKMLELVVPELEGFKLKPYIAKTVPKWAPEARR